MISIYCQLDGTAREDHETHTCFGQRLALEIGFGRYDEFIAELCQRILCIQALSMFLGVSVVFLLILHLRE